jgi:hypothetical protein
LLQDALNDPKALSLSLNISQLWRWIGCAEVALAQSEVTQPILYECFEISKYIKAYIVQAHPYAYDI